MFIYVRNRKMLRLVYWLALGCFLGLFQLTVTAAQNNTFDGWLSVVYGDPETGSGESPRFVAVLTDGQGGFAANLTLDAGIAKRLQGQYVEVVGTGGDVSAQGIDVPTIQVQSIRAVVPPVGTELMVSAMVSGSQPFINLKCQFPDRPVLNRDHTYYDPLFGSTYPGLNHYWQQMSYGGINLNGTMLIDIWYTLPHPRSFYLTSAGVNLAGIATDCTSVAESAVFFPNYVGINIMLNDAIGCCAWGTEGYPYTLDNVFKFYPTTWLPPWGQKYSTLGHEMGHGFGLDHSSGPASNPPPDDLSIYISDWDIMSNSSGAFFEGNGDYGWTPPGIIAFDVDRLNQMPANRKATITPGIPTTITLEQLRATPTSLPGNVYLMAEIPINGSFTHFYTVEVRSHIGYDVNIPAFTPAAVVLIYDVDLSRTTNAGPALIVDVDYANGGSNLDVNDAGAMWTTGEEFFDTRNNISIAIGALSGTRYSVTVAKESPANAAPPRNFYRTPTPLLRWERISWATGYNLQIDDSGTFADPFVFESGNLSVNQLSLSPSLPDGFYYWRVCALKADNTCGAWSTPEHFEVNTS